MSLFWALLLLLSLSPGILLLRRVPLSASRNEPEGKSLCSLSVVIPARNEERNIGLLLDSLHNSSFTPEEILVVDDNSIDKTAENASQHGARVLSSQPLPPGWTGKNWACHQGALAAKAKYLLFLDADTSVANQAGLERIVAMLDRYSPQSIALSFLPYHLTERPYEELSVFFHLFMAIGAGGFGVFGASKLFGQALLLEKELYLRCGGHQQVRAEILENFAMASNVQKAGAACLCLGGREVLNIRMFPEGLQQLMESWKKGFASGAAGTSPVVLLLSFLWIAAGVSDCLLLVMPSAMPASVRLSFYLAYAAQLHWMSRQIGSYRWWTALFYPVFLLFYLFLFSQSLWIRLSGRKAVWRGREI